MPVHSVIVINSSGNVVFSKYFHDASRDRQSCCRENLLFEQALCRHTSKAWTNKILTQVPLTLAIGNIYVVFQRIDELLVFVSGFDDVDEEIRKKYFFISHFPCITPCFCSKRNSYCVSPRFK